MTDTGNAEADRQAVRTARVGLAYSLAAFPATLLPLSLGTLALMDWLGAEYNPIAFSALVGLQLLIVLPAITCCSMVFAIYGLPSLVRHSKLRPGMILWVGLGVSLFCVICVSLAVYGRMAFTAPTFHLLGVPVFAIFVAYGMWIRWKLIRTHQ